MADEGPDKDSKTEEPTSKRLSDARAQGDLPKSPDLSQWATLAAASSVVLLAGGWMAQNLMYSLEPLIAHPDAYRLQNNGALNVAKLAAGAALPIFATVMSASITGGFFGNFIQTGLVWAPDKIKPDVSKLSPFAGSSPAFANSDAIHAIATSSPF